MGSVIRMGVAAKLILIQGDRTPVGQNGCVVAKPPEIVGRSVNLVLKQTGLYRPADILSSICLHEGYGTVILIIVDTRYAQFITNNRLVHMPVQGSSVLYSPLWSFFAHRKGALVRTIVV